MNPVAVKTIRIIRPASREKTVDIQNPIKQLESSGFVVRFDDRMPSANDWPYTSGSIEARANELNSALFEEGTDAIWCGRGGYGCSDLLPLIEWDKLKRIRPKLCIGFSDISALHSALWTKLNWHGLHAPMPATELWPSAIEPDYPAINGRIDKEDWCLTCYS
jgi:muramoyltetrapeptide carboxypeptidase